MTTYYIKTNTLTISGKYLNYLNTSICSINNVIHNILDENNIVFELRLQKIHTQLILTVTYTYEIQHYGNIIVYVPGK